MKIAVLGTGMVGQAVAAKLSDLGHEMAVGTRDPQATLARTEPDAMGNPPFSAWHAEHPAVRLATFAEAAAQAELVVNATRGGVSRRAEPGRRDQPRRQGAARHRQPARLLAGLPTQHVRQGHRLPAEQIQRAFPEARVVKSLNTMTAALMVDPARVGGGDHSTFVSGDDPEAKQTVVDLLTSLGHTDVIDVGDLSTARGTEMLLPIWVRLMGALGTPLLQLQDRALSAG